MTTDTLLGRTLGKYKITEHLGRGGMAEVYKGYREDLDRTVAIKLMHGFLVAEEDFLSRFKREARAMAQMRHPNVVSVFDFDCYQGNTYYLVMEYIAGGTLKEKLTELAERGERLPLAHAVRIASEVADALIYAHDHDMIHRDIKPANIMLDESGKAILTDFGIVKLVGGQSMAFTATGALIGTPAYMSPEQALGKPGDARSDLYSLGVLLFQMITGQLPFAADTPLAVVMKHVNDPVPLPIAFNPDVPVGLQQVVLRAMAKDPDDRYQSVREMATVLKGVDLTGGSGEAAGASQATMLAMPDLPAFDTSSSSKTSVAATAVLSPESTGTAASGTAAGRTVIPPEVPGVKKKRSALPYIAAFLALATVVAIVFASGILNGDGSEPEDASPIAGVASVEANVPDTPTSPPPTDTSEPTQTPEDVSTPLAAIVETPSPTPSATPTNTSTPKPSATPTAGATPNATATYLASCVYDAELVNAFTYGTNTNSAPVSATFPVNWVLKNSGTCPWPASLEWSYHTGVEFGNNVAPVAVGGVVAPDDEITLSARLVAPANVGTYDSTWQLVDAQGNAFASPLSFQVRTYVPATATPAATPTPPPSPTSEAPLAFHFGVGGCEYQAAEWRCMLTISPYGGGGGPYTLWVFEHDQPAEYRGPGPFSHFTIARRCGLWIHNIRIQDDASGTFLSQDISINPNDHFPGGCTLP